MESIEICRNTLRLTNALDTALNTPEKRLSAVENRLSILDRLPSNAELIYTTLTTDDDADDQMRERALQEKRVSHMWKSVNTNSRLDATEEGISRLSSLIDDILKHTKRLAEENSALHASLEKAKDDKSLKQRCLELEQKLALLEKQRNQDANLLKNVAHMDALRGLVFWHTLGAAITGIDRIAAYAATAEVTGDRSLAIDAATKLDAVEGQVKLVEKLPDEFILCPDPDLLTTLRKIGTVASDYDGVLQRIDRLEELIGQKADRLDLENLGVPDELLERLASLEALMKEIVKEREKRSQRVKQLRTSTAMLDPTSTIDTTVEIDGEPKVTPDLNLVKAQKTRSDSITVDWSGSLKAGSVSSSGCDSTINPSTIDHQPENTKLIRDLKENLNLLRDQVARLTRLVQDMQSNSDKVKSTFDDLQQQIDDLDSRKVNILHMNELLDKKADRTDLADLMGRQEFLETSKEMQKIMEDLFSKLTLTEEELRALLQTMEEALTGKIDRDEFEELREWMEKRFKSYGSRLRSMQSVSPIPAATGTRIPTSDEAAGLRRGLMQHYHCISCDRPLQLAPEQFEASGQCFDTPSFPTSKSIRPYTTFELESFRHHFHPSGSSIHDIYGVPRRCGGIHTVTTPHRRINRGNTARGFIGGEDGHGRGLSPRDEVGLEGYDGHIYRGRVNLQEMRALSAERLEQLSDTEEMKLPPITQTPRNTLKSQDGTMKRDLRISRSPQRGKSRSLVPNLTGLRHSGSPNRRVQPVPPSVRHSDGLIAHSSGYALIVVPNATEEPASNAEDKHKDASETGGNGDVKPSPDSRMRIESIETPLPPIEPEDSNQTDTQIGETNYPPPLETEDLDRSEVALDPDEYPSDYEQLNDGYSAHNTADVIDDAVSDFMNNVQNNPHDCGTSNNHDYHINHSSKSSVKNARVRRAKPLATILGKASFFPVKRSIAKTQSAVDRWETAQIALSEANSRNTLLQKQLQECRNELRTVQRQCKVQSSRLNKAIGEEADLPKIIDRLSSEIRSLQLRLREKSNLFDLGQRKIAELQHRIFVLEKEREERQDVLTTDEETLKRKGSKLDETMGELDRERKKNTSLQHQLEVSKRSIKQQMNTSQEKLQEVRRTCRDLEDQLAEKTQALQEKTKLLELQNIYSLRMPKNIPSHLPPTADSLDLDDEEGDSFRATKKPKSKHHSHARVGDRKEEAKPANKTGHQRRISLSFGKPRNRRRNSSVDQMSEPIIDSISQGQPEIQSQGQSEVHSQGQPEVQPEVQLEVQPEVQLEVQPEVQLEGQHGDQTEKYLGFGGVDEIPAPRMEAVTETTSVPYSIEICPTSSGQSNETEEVPSAVVTQKSQIPRLFPKATQSCNDNSTPNPMEGDAEKGDDNGQIDDDKMVSTPMYSVQEKVPESATEQPDQEMTLMMDHLRAKLDQISAENNRLKTVMADQQASNQVDTVTLGEMRDEDVDSGQTLSMEINWNHSDREEQERERRKRLLQQLEELDTIEQTSNAGNTISTSPSIEDAHREEMTPATDLPVVENLNKIDKHREQELWDELFGPEQQMDPAPKSLSQPKKPARRGPTTTTTLAHPVKSTPPRRNPMTTVKQEARARCESFGRRSSAKRREVHSRNPVTTVTKSPVGHASLLPTLPGLNQSDHQQHPHQAPGRMHPKYAQMRGNFHDEDDSEFEEFQA